MHRDLKPENVLLDGAGAVKLSDFGLGALPDNARADGMLKTACGTPNYVAPEVLQRAGYAGAPADIWSLGARLHSASMRVLHRHWQAGLVWTRGACSVQADALGSRILPRQVQCTGCPLPPAQACPQLCALGRAGVCLYIITTGTLPFDEPNLPMMFDKISRADYPSAPWWSPELAHLIQHILMPDPLQRCVPPSVQAVWAQVWAAIDYWAEGRLPATQPHLAGVSIPARGSNLSWNAALLWKSWAAAERAWRCKAGPRRTSCGSTRGWR